MAKSFPLDRTRVAAVNAVDKKGRPRSAKQIAKKLRELSVSFEEEGRPMQVLQLRTGGVILLGGPSVRAITLAEVLGPSLSPEPSPPPGHEKASHEKMLPEVAAWMAGVVTAAQMQPGLSKKEGLRAVTRVAESRSRSFPREKKEAYIAEVRRSLAVHDDVCSEEDCFTGPIYKALIAGLEVSLKASLS
jgi:hypothetical protein